MYSILRRAREQEDSHIWSPITWQTVRGVSMCITLVFGLGIIYLSEDKGTETS